MAEANRAWLETGQSPLGPANGLGCGDSQAGGLRSVLHRFNRLAVEQGNGL